MRDAQRLVAELRTDLEARRQDLSESQVARAQLEGRVREAERRVIEARQVIELQREELAAARMERGRVSRSSMQLQGQMKQLHKQLSKAEKSDSDQGQDGQAAASFPSSRVRHKGQKATQVPVHRSQASEYREPQQLAATSASMVQMSINHDASSMSEAQRPPSRHVSVKTGDTLWSIAQKYRVNMEQLRALNQLTDNKIIIGQALWLPDDPSLPGSGTDLASSSQ
ncbi:MAG: LysM peptidoglycan-binding domain-containing protein [Nitrospirae bacterium]|nr:LysM peptidoglycan-binding domain-containing protein [Nitrospirota bacterium]